MKIKTEAAAVIQFRNAELRELAAVSRKNREFGIAQRLDQIIEVLEEARLFILNPVKAKPAGYEMPTLFKEFLETAPAGSKITNTFSGNSGYESNGDGQWRRFWTNEYGAQIDQDFYYSPGDFAEGENADFNREVPRG